MWFMHSTEWFRPCLSYGIISDLLAWPDSSFLLPYRPFRASCGLAWWLCRRVRSRDVGTEQPRRFNSGKRHQGRPEHRYILNILNEHPIILVLYSVCCWMLPDLSVPFSSWSNWPSKTNECSCSAKSSVESRYGHTVWEEWGREWKKTNECFWTLYSVQNCQLSKVSPSDSRCSNSTRGKIQWRKLSRECALRRHQPSAVICSSNPAWTFSGTRFPSWWVDLPYE